MTGLIHGLLSAFFPPMPEPLDEISPGRRATVRGQVVARDLLRSPLSERECVYYQYTVEEWRKSTFNLGGDGFWHMTERDEAISEFYIQQGDRRALISPYDAKVEPRRGVSPELIDLGTSARRARELLVAPGDWIEVVGQVDRIDDLFDHGRDYRGSPNRLCLRAPAGQSLLVRILQSS